MEQKSHTFVVDDPNTSLINVRNIYISGLEKDTSRLGKISSRYFAIGAKKKNLAGRFIVS